MFRLSFVYDEVIFHSTLLYEFLSQQEQIRGYLLGGWRGKIYAHPKTMFSYLSRIND